MELRSYCVHRWASLSFCWDRLRFRGSREFHVDPREESGTLKWPAIWIFTIHWTHCFRKRCRNVAHFKASSMLPSMAMMEAATAMKDGSRNCTMNFRRRRRIMWPFLLLSVPTTAFSPLLQNSAARPWALSATSRTWDQTRHKLVYYGDVEEDPSPPKIISEKKKTKPMPITGYDANQICKTYDRRPFQVGWRMNAVGLPLLGKSEEM